MDTEGLQREAAQLQAERLREEIQSQLKKIKKSQLAYVKNTDWMFSGQQFEAPLEHMPSYYL